MLYKNNNKNQKIAQAWINEKSAKVIDRFSGEHDYLSNFFLSPIPFEGKEYPSVEHAYQAAKTINPEEREKIRLASTPGLSKKMGRLVELRLDWGDIKIDVMRNLVRNKFERNSKLKEYLLNTLPHDLVEGNTWGDKFWGVCDGEGENYLGKILMEIREEFKNLKKGQ